MKRERTNIPKKTLMRSLLQQEINSLCPFCNNTDVGHFQIHHIDENPQNNQFSNLILICPICHSKITKGEILYNFVVEKKNTLKHTLTIECANTSISHTMCSWENYPETENAFCQNDKKLSPFPIINFSFINNSDRTILFKEIQLEANDISSGISGIPKVSILKPISSFNIEIPVVNKKITFKIDNEIQIPSKHAFKIQVQLFEKFNSLIVSPTGKRVLYFRFVFNNIILEIEPIFLNCRGLNDNNEIVYLS